jgi:hypothetical protein
VRERSVAVIERAIADSVPAEIAPLAANALWLLMMSLLLVYINDDSPGEKRTHGLVDDALDMIVGVLPMLGTPVGKALCDRVTAALARADVSLV